MPAFASCNSFISLDLAASTIWRILVPFSQSLFSSADLFFALLSTGVLKTKTRIRHYGLMVLGTIFSSLASDGLSMDYSRSVLHHFDQCGVSLS